MSHPKPSIAVVFVLYGCLTAGLTVSADEKVDNSNVRTSLTPETTTFMLKAPASVRFTIHNDADRDLFVLLGGDNRNALGRPDTFKVTVTDSHYKLVPQPDARFAFGGISWMQKVPAKGKYDVQLYLPHWATFETPGAYVIRVKRPLKATYGPIGDFPKDDELTSFEVAAMGTIRVEPYDDEKMGALIEKRGAELLVANSDVSEAALRDLSCIYDDRIIPYYVKGLETKLYEIQFGSLRALGRYNDDRALAALKRGMHLDGDDVANTTTQQVAEQLGKNLRHICATALASSPHPDAIPFLLTRRKDPSDAVRITILHVLGKMKPAQALPILREMAADKDERVRNEAKRYIDLLSAKPQ